MSGTDIKAVGGAGLRGQSAGETALCTVGKTGAGLTYRGYPIDVLAEKASFEEVAHLLLRGKLPTSLELENFTQELLQNRALPPQLKAILELLPAETAPMDVLRTGVSVLGDLEPESGFANQQTAAVRMLAAIPSILLYWWRFVTSGTRVETETNDTSIAAHFLHLLRGEIPDPDDIRVMNVSLILYAEHEFNASTFAARVCASTLSDIYSCVVAAIGTLKGPLHGGANEAAMDMLEKFHSPDEAETAILHALATKQKIMGFGHAIYRTHDPRSPIIQAWAKRLSEKSGDKTLYPTAERVAAVMWREKKLFPNADFFHAPAYRFLRIPTPLFTPIFVCSRVTGWCAHVMEQRHNNRIIRPSADYTGPLHAEWTDISQRV
ncbi:MAG: bifunctional 2-methylcitrate synthase/citrate synthase [Phycisphaerae bacterium]